MHIKDLNNTILSLKPFLRKYLEEKFPEIVGKHIFSCISPTHTDSDPSCHIYGPEDSPRIRCFGCDFDGDIIDTCCLIENKPKKGKAWLTDTIKYLCEKFEVPIEMSELTDDELYEIETYRAYEIAASLIKTELDPDVEAEKEAFLEAERRGWTTETLTKYKIGTVPDYDIFIKHLEKAGFQQKFLREVDLANKSIFTPQNLIFTWCDEHGRPVGFIGRNLSYIKGKEGTNKYHNTKTTGCKCNIFRKDSRLYGIDSALKSTPPLWIFEGQADAITCKQDGLDNCASISSGILSSRQIDYIKSLGIYSIILVLDADEAGQNHLDKIVNERFPEHKDLDVKIVHLPPGEDPDSFVRVNGVQALFNLPKKSIFEYKLDKFDPQDDPNDISKEMIPYIAMEPSPIRRETYCNLLAQRIDISKRAIQDELQQVLDATAYKVSRERDTVIDKVIHELKADPTSAQEILRNGHDDILDINIKYNTNSFSLDAAIKRIEDIKAGEENKSGKFEGFRLGEDLKSFQDVLLGNWLQDVMLFIGGKPNSGKSALVAKMAWSILDNKENEDTIIIFHSIDDTLSKLIPRLVCLADDSLMLTLFHTANPKYWSKQPFPNADLIGKRRIKAYKKVLDQIHKSRLILKDSTDGQSLSYVESMLAYYSKDESKKIIYILDNFHKLDWFAGMKDERTRWRRTSCEMKRLIEKYHVTGLQTVEYHKIPPGTKPSNYSLAESQQLEYDADFIVHVYNELADIPSKCKVYHNSTNWKHEVETFPRIELTVGKNKICDNKSTFFLDFYPYCSNFRYVDYSTVLLEAKEQPVADPFQQSGVDI